MEHRIFKAVEIFYMMADRFVIVNFPKPIGYTVPRESPNVNYMGDDDMSMDVHQL